MLISCIVKYKNQALNYAFPVLFEKEETVRNMANRIFLMTASISLMASVCSAASIVGSEDKLLQGSDFTYLGAFKVPPGAGKGDSTRDTSLTFGGELLTYSPHNNSLYIMGSRNMERMVYQISIPEPVKSSSLAALNTATFLSGGFDITGGIGWDALGVNNTILGNGGYPGGLLVFPKNHEKSKYMIGNSWAYYDGSGAAVNSHFYTNAVLPYSGYIANVKGYYAVGKRVDTPGKGNGGFVGGYMCWIPQAWREALGGKALTGMGGISVITRSSYGPSAWVFDPEDFFKPEISANSLNNPVSADMLLGYPSAHTSLGAYAGARLIHEATTYSREFFGNLGDMANSRAITPWGWNGSGAPRGIAFPEGSKSVLIFGRMGMGNSNYGAGDNAEGTLCYGPGTTIKSEAGRVGGQSCNDGKSTVGGGDHCCYDPTNTNKGGHAYPYKARIWAYNADDLADVKKGTKYAWNVLPYAIWDFDFPYIDEAKNGSRDIGQVAYDPATQRLFISQLITDNPGYARFPVIHVYRLNLGMQATSINGEIAAPVNLGFTK